VNDLTATIREILERCVGMEMQTPFIMCAVSPNGSVLAMRVEGDGSAGEPLAEHSEEHGFALPMTMVVVDQRNEAVRLCSCSSC